MILYLDLDDYHCCHGVSTEEPCSQCENEITAIETGVAAGHNLYPESN